MLTSHRQMEVQMAMAAKAAAQAIGQPKLSPIESEFNSLMDSLSGLEGSVAWILSRIQPVLQPHPEVGNGQQTDQEARDVASSLRERLRKAREFSDSIASKIEAARYAIEI